MTKAAIKYLVSILIIVQITFISINVRAENISQYRLDIKIFLEGAYIPNTGLMSTKIRKDKLLSETQPFANNKFIGTIYGGFSIPNINNIASTQNVVDWVFIKFRSEQGYFIQYPVLLRNDGYLLDPYNVIADPNNPTLESGINLNALYSRLTARFPYSYPPNGINSLIFNFPREISVYHSNHLAILSKSIFSFYGSGTATVDLTTPLGNATVKASQARLNASFPNDLAVYGMRVGDVNNDGSIDASDRSIARNTPDLANINSVSDLNTDGSIDATDRNIARTVPESVQQII